MKCLNFQMENISLLKAERKKRKAEITSLKIKYGKLASTKERMHKSENAGKHKDVKEDGI